MIGRAFQSILHHPCSSSIGTPRLKLKKAPQRGWQVTSASKLICRKIWECASQLVLCITHSASMLRLEVCLCVCVQCVCVCVCVCVVPSTLATETSQLVLCMAHSSQNIKATTMHMDSHYALLSSPSIPSLSFMMLRRVFL